MKVSANTLPQKSLIPAIFCVLVLLLPTAIVCLGQQPQGKIVSAVKTSADEYATEPIVIEKHDISYTFHADGTGFRESTVAARVQSDATVRQLGVLKIAFTGDSEHVELKYVRVRHSDGTVTETPPSATIEVTDPIVSAAPLYSDLKQLQIPVRSLRVGDRLEWQARIVITKPETPNKFWGTESFVTNNVVLEESIELHIPKNLLVQVWSGSIKPTESTTETEHIYRWESTQTKPTVGAQADAEKERKKKQLLTSDEELDAKEGKLPDVAWTTFKNWAEVGAWYRNLEGDRASGYDDEIRAKTAEITAGKNTQEEKVRAIYNYVSTQIRYIGLDFGIGRYQPHLASQVLDYQYGDCKDKHTLMAAMLRAAGFHPEAVLIGVQIRFQESVPSPLSFNHVITRVDVDGKSAWLDSTTEVAPYRALLFVLRDKSALVIPAEGASSIEPTPADLPYPALDTMDAKGELDENGISHSHLVITFHSDSEVLVRATLHQITADHYDVVVQKMANAMGYAGTTSHPAISNPTDTTEPLRIAFDYVRERAGSKDWERLQIVPQVLPVYMMQIDESTPPVQAIQLGAPHIERSTSAMKLPTGWTAKLPDEKHIESPWVTYDQTYRFEHGTLYSERTIAILQKEIPVASWKEYKTFTDKADLGNESYINLVKPGTIPTGSGSVSVPKAQALVASAYELLKKNDLNDAKLLLDQARAMNKKEPRLWAIYGAIANYTGNWKDAISDGQKELENSGANPAMYQWIARIQTEHGQKDEAHKTLETWVSEQPESGKPVIALVELMLHEGKYQEALNTVTDASKRLLEAETSSNDFQLLLGKTQLKAGEIDAGNATIAALMQNSTDPRFLNNAAYALRDLNVNLSVLETAATKALSLLDEASESFSVRDHAEDAVRQSKFIAEIWDTLGWIYFREGKLSEAENYIQAAWKSNRDTEIGFHLAEVEIARKNYDSALRDLLLAQTIFPKRKHESTAEEEQFVTEIARVRILGAKDPAFDATQALIQMRTFALEPTNGDNGTAEYHLLMKEGAVLDVEKMGDKQITGIEERLRKVRLSPIFPEGSKAQLVRDVAVSCISNKCEMIIEP